MRKRFLLQAANLTDTSTTQGTEFQMTVLRPDVIKYAEKLRFLRQWVTEDTTVLLPDKRKTVRIPKTTSHRTITVSHTEGAERTYTEMTNLDTVDITPTQKLGAIGITKELVDTCGVNLIDLARYMMVQHHEQAVEDDIVDVIEAGVSTNILYGGDATTAATLATGDTLTVDLLADAIAAVKDDDFQLNPGVIYIAPQQEKVLFKSSQFTNAAEYGGREVVLNGEIGRYLGCKVLVTGSCKTYANGATDLTDASAWGAAGHSLLIMGQMAGQKVAATLAWKQKLSVDYEYLKRYCNHYIYHDAAFKTGVIQEKCICLLKVTDA